jgi:hypothetical protein
MHSKLLLFFSLISFSCGETDKSVEIKTDVDSSSQDTVNQNPFPGSDVKSDDYDAAYADTLFIDSRAAVFFQPDSLTIEKKIKEQGEEFLLGMDDYLHYMSESQEYLEKQGVPILHAKGEKYLKFTMADKSFKVINLRKQEDLWGVYLFDPNKKPHYADILDMEEDFKKYFGDDPQ